MPEKTYVPKVYISADEILRREIVLKYSEKLHKQQYASFKTLKMDILADKKIENVNENIKTSIMSELKNICKISAQKIYENIPFEINYTHATKESFPNVEEYDETLTSTNRCVLTHEVSDEIYEKRALQFKKMSEIILPEQRSPEWFAQRNERITASDTGVVLNENKYEPQFQFILNKVFGRTFKGDIKTTHGRRFEQSAILTYELYHNVTVRDFGLMDHQNGIGFLAASPDGICEAIDCFGKKSPLVARMLEIKCPLVRQVHTSGTIKDHICPLYYWDQVQLQLECCDLEECDFVQCKIIEYSGRAEYMNDKHPDVDYLSKSYGKPRGVVIELLPANLEPSKMKNGIPTDEAIFEDTTFIHPPYLNMTNEELDNWILYEIDNLNKQTKVKLHRVIYWKMTEHVFTLIKREREWFASNLPKMEKMWGYVKYLRQNPDVGTEWKQYIENRSTKINKIILAKLDELILLKNSGKFVPSEKIKVVEEVKSNASDEENHNYVRKKKTKAELDDMFSF